MQDQKGRQISVSQEFFGFSPSMEASCRQFRRKDPDKGWRERARFGGTDLVWNIDDVRPVSP